MENNTLATPDTLNSLMEFDSPIRSHGDGTITEYLPTVYAPECYIDVDSDGSITDEMESAWIEGLRREGWELMRGYTGQYSYNGPIMHPSEFIGGGLARHILETPGVYVAVAVEVDCGYVEEFCTEESGCSCEPAGWAIAYREEYNGPMTEVYHYGNERRVTEWPSVQALEAHLLPQAEHATDPDTRAARRRNTEALIATLRAGNTATWSGWSTYTPSDVA
jgi:hypothetical protein